MGQLRLGVIGCGAVAEALHLPAIARSNKVELTVVVDQSADRGCQFATRYNVPYVQDFRDIVGNTDAVIIALPNHLHAPVAIDLLRRGIHVLVEKPMALTTCDCDAMIAASLEGHAVLAVGFMRRFYRATRYVKEVLESDLLGNLHSFSFREGSVLDWTSVSGYMFRKENAGGGVLMDVGVHLFDLLLWWFGDPTELEYFDDAMGGVEADSECIVQLKQGIKGRIELSRIRNLSNTYLFEGEKGTLEVGTSVNPGVRLRLKNRELDLSGKVLSDGQSDSAMVNAFVRQVDDFADSICERRNPAVSGHDGRRSLGLIESCYASRKPLLQPWIVQERFV